MTNIVRFALPATSFISTKQLFDSASAESYFLFEKLKIKSVFFCSRNFNASIAVARRLTVTNDTAERAIALIQAFNCKITMSENKS